MAFLLRASRLLSMSLWVGAISFFAFVLAPVAFHSLPSPHEAGLVVRGSILILHRIGLVCGVAFLIATVVLRRACSAKTRTLLTAQCALAFAMIAITMISQWDVLPRMESDRAEAGGDINTLAPQHPSRMSFNHLHALSEQMEGAVLLLGLAVILLEAGAQERKL